MTNITTITTTKAKEKLTSMVRKAHTLGEKFIITHRGEKYGVLMDAEEYEGLLETIDILKDSKMEIDSLTVKFEDFISEGRCPENTICIWQGEAIIEISLKDNLAIELSTAYNYNVPLDTLGYKIRLYDLKPYPKRWNQVYKKSKYEATLNISK